MNVGEDDSNPTSDSLEEAYRAQTEAAMLKESQRRVSEAHDPIEIARLEELSLVELAESDDLNLVPALMARLGPVRAALDGEAADLLPLLRERRPAADGGARAYVCRDATCSAPLEDVSEFAQLLARSVRADG